MGKKKDIDPSCFDNKSIKDRAYASKIIKDLTSAYHSTFANKLKFN